MKKTKLTLLTLAFVLTTASLLLINILGIIANELQVSYAQILPRSQGNSSASIRVGIDHLAGYRLQKHNNNTLTHHNLITIWTICSTEKYSSSLSYLYEYMSYRDPMVKGKIIFDKDAKPFSGATIYVRLEDTTLQDVPSKVISEQIIKNTSYDPINTQKIEFVLNGFEINTRARYTVSVHVDVDTDGKINPGDFINMESYPVLTYGFPDTVLVHVKQIK